MSFLDSLERNRRERPHHPYLRHGDETVDFAEFDRRSNRAAHALRRLGVEKGDRVTLAMGNSVEWLAAAYGALKAGALLHPVNPALGARELGWILAHADPRVIVTDRAAPPTVRAADVRPKDARVALFGGAEDELADAIALEPLLAESPDGPPGVTFGADDASLLLYTSGTTGAPKGVLFTHDRPGVSGAFVTGLGIVPGDVVLAVGPLFHGNAWGAASVAMDVGCTLAFPKTFSASAFWPLVHETGATVLFTLGTFLAILLAEDRGSLESTSRLRLILGLGSAPIRAEVKRRFRVPDVLECFGSTDAGVVTLEPVGATPRSGSAGPPLAGVRLRILDDEGRELPPRAPGEIAVASPFTMAGYYRDPERTREAFRGEWFLTGDLGYLDEDGWLYFVDRKRDVIRRGGENVSSVLVESVLREHPAVADVAVVGVRHPVLGQELKAFVVSREAVTAEDLRAFAAERLASFQVPSLWEFREALPKTATQRTEKYKLRRESDSSSGPLLG